MATMMLTPNNEKPMKIKYSKGPKTRKELRLLAQTPQKAVHEKDGTKRAVRSVLESHQSMTHINMDTNQRLLNPYTYTDAKTETEERKQWLEGIKLWKQRKDAQCIVIHGNGWVCMYLPL